MGRTGGRARSLVARVAAAKTAHGSIIGAEGTQWLMAGETVPSAGIHRVTAPPRHSRDPPT